MRLRKIAACASVLAGCTASNAAAPRESVHPVARAALPNAPGKELVAVEVRFPPGGASIPHRHAPSAFVYAYVVSGVVVSAVNDEKPRAYHAGESWQETPGALHRLTRNGSRTKPARLLAIFIADQGESQLVRSAK